jgi:hypothetical protein
MFFGAKPQWDSHAGILRFTNMPNGLMPTAMSLGSVNVFNKEQAPKSDNNMSLGVSTGREESLHTIQSRILGPLYFPLHGIAMGISALIPASKSRYSDIDRWHRSNFLEFGPMTGRIF